MITIVYTIRPEERTDEIEWLREQKIFPAIEESWDWKTMKPLLKVGVIVSSAAALSIKLRHKLELQVDYHPR